MTALSAVEDPGLASSHPPLFTHEHLQLRRCRSGMMLYNLNDSYIGAMLEKYGEFSEGETDLFQQVVRPGMILVEAGANIGAHTLTLARLVGPQGRVLAFEPQRAIFQMLCANVALNGLEQVETYWAAVGAEPGYTRVPRLNSRVRQNFGGLAISGAQAGDRVAQLTIDSFELPACHLLKIDVEGMEVEVINGASDTIRRCAPLIYAENDRPQRSAELLGLLHDLDYRCYAHWPPYVRMPNFRGDGENLFPNIVSRNLLCAPRSRNLVVSGLEEVARPTT